VSFPANCFRRTEVKCLKKPALLHEFDDNVAIVTTTVASITTGLSSFRQNNASRGRWFNLGFGLRAGGVSAAPAPAMAVGVSPAPAGLFQLPSHTSLLKRPFASAANATGERSVSQREHRERYRTFALRNAQQIAKAPVHWRHEPTSIHQVSVARCPDKMPRNKMPLSGAFCLVAFCPVEFCPGLLSLTPYVESLQCIHVGDQEGIIMFMYLRTEPTLSVLGTGVP